MKGKEIECPDQKEENGRMKPNFFFKVGFKMTMDFSRGVHSVFKRLSKLGRVVQRFGQQEDRENIKKFYEIEFRIGEMFSHF